MGHRLVVATTGCPIHLEIDLRFADGSIAGQMRIDQGPARPFTGWLDLMASVERLRPGGFDDQDAHSPGK